MIEFVIPNKELSETKVPITQLIEDEDHTGVQFKQLSYNEYKDKSISLTESVSVRDATESVGLEQDWIISLELEY